MPKLVNSNISSIRNNNLLYNNLTQVRKITEEGLTIYNTERPHEALHNMIPIEYKTLKQAV
ncbi:MULTISPECIES: integrase core domain-containing protein [unclassified Gilliamella]|jgi:putative transposase|uniref:integrase core domain-containing protein n=1 Tax=unclassified Gilliamella TaxID=2685620 RepID=UPI0009C105FD|nr:integrase core domain-containing protein [Gilliamella apicola]